MAAPQASSRLELLQARFQQKQLQEKEQKLLQLYDQQQQRAYQVVQRGSAGSNGSNHTATISQHTITKTSSSSHTTSTSQGGKVRQMFDERRQTTVKGIDRSYPLEPLENKPRKQANGNSVQKNGNLTVNRQSVTVRRVARADVNSNLNGGKPVVSYHEEITRESFGPSARQHQGDDEFGNENHVGRYTNGNHRDGIHIEEVLDEDMIERNRMMAKLHLMEYDESLKHRVKNDLESEEFPEDFMVDVPDKLPKQSVTKKLSQAEARLERFKNANVKRGSYVAKNPTIAPKKRSDPIFPAKSSSEDRATKTGSCEVSDGRRKDPASNKLRVETLIPEITGETVSPDSARYVGRRDDNPRFFCKESEKSATTYAIDSRTAKKLSPELSKDRTQRSDRSKSFTISREFEKYPTDLNVTRTSTFKSLKDGMRRRQSPKLFPEDAEKLTASSAIALRNIKKLPSEISRDVKERSESPKFFCRESERSATTYAADPKTVKKFSSEKTAATRAIDPKSAERLIQGVSEVVKDVKRRSASPKFFCKESEKSATTYAIDPKIADKSTRVSLRDMKDVKGRSESPKFFCKESGKSATTYAIDPKATKKLSSGSLRDTKDRADGPKFFCKESERSATTYAIDSRSPSVSPVSTKNRESSVSKMKKSKGKKDTIKESMNDRIKRHVKSLKHDAIKRPTFPKYVKHDTTSYAKPNYPKGSKSTLSKSSSFPTRERSLSPHFFFREGRKSTRKKSIDDKDAKFISRFPGFSEKNIKKRSEGPRIVSIIDAVKSKSPDFAKLSCRKSSTSPQYLSDSDRSTTFMMVTPKTITKPRTEFACSKSREQSPTLPVSKSGNAVMAEPKRNDSSMESYDESSRQFIRSSVSRFFSEQCEKATGNADVRKHVQSAKIDKKGYSSRDSSPLSLKDMRTPSPTKPQFYRGRTEKADRRTSVDTDSNRDSSPKYRKIVDSGEETSEFVRRETENPAVTVRRLEPRISRNVTKGSSEGPKSIKQAVLREIVTKTKTLLNNVKNKSSRSPNNLTAKDSNSTSKDKNTFDRRGSSNTLRSTKLIRDAAKGNSTTKNTNPLNRRGSSNVLCSTKLIRDASKRQNGRNQAVVATEKSRSSSEHASEISSEWEQRSRTDRVQEVTTVNKNVDERARTSAFGELSAARSSLRSCASAKMDTDVREIVVPDQCIKQEKLRGTYSRSSNKTAGERPGSEKLFTYSVRKPVKRRGSLLQSNIFERSVKNSREEKPISSRYKSPNAFLKRETVVGGVKSGTKSEKDTLRSGGRTAGPIQTGEKNMTPGKSCTTQSINRDSKRRIVGNTNRRSENKISRVGGRTSSPFEIQEKRGEVNSTEKETKTLSEQVYILKSVSLVQNVTKEPDFTEKSRKLIRETIPDGTVAGNQIAKSGPASSTIDIGEPEHIVVSLPSSKNYERTDSVESALRRFNSIGMETGSIRGTSKRSAESIAEKRQTKSGETADDSKTISLEALDRPDVNLSSTSRTSTNTEAGRQGKPRGTSERKNAQKKLEKLRDSMETTRIAMRSRSPSCRRKLFQDGDSSEATETGSTASRCSLDSTRTVEHLSTMFNKNETPGSMNTASKRFKFSASDETLTEMTDKGETDQVSTGVDCSVKQLRSIEDIRKSVEDESSDRKRRKTSAKSAIVGNALRDLSVAKATVRSEPRRINIDARAGNRIEISLPRRSGNVTASNDALGDTGRSCVKCTMRFSRVAKSPSPETTKATETSTRTRRTIPAPPSKSPDTVARRSSTELKAQDTKSTKRPTPMKGTEPIGNRKMTTTATTSTNTKKSTDVVDGAILENGLHLRDQTFETKYDNDSLTTKKNDAFVVDFDEQPPKENDAPLPRKSLLRKQSTEKQNTSAQSARPPSSVSSTSSGSSMQGQTSGLKSKMAFRAKTPISGSTSYKGSASSKTGSAAAATDALVPCKMCGRRFAQDRITLHEQICTKTMQKKRKQFDTMMYRVKGTDLESFVKKGLTKKQLEKSKKPEVKSNWRRKHEDFINAIRSAKQVQAHLAAGGKLSDLPPPPVSDNCDYIQCPHCGRKFNKAAAERHIPKCEHMLHNKPIHSRAPKPKR